MRTDTTGYNLTEMLSLPQTPPSRHKLSKGKVPCPRLLTSVNRHRDLLDVFGYVRYSDTLYP